MKSLVIEPHYLGSLEFYAAISDAEEVVFDIGQTYKKQTFRNRTKFLGANGVLTLSVPVIYDSRTSFEEVVIDYNQKWLNIHWGAFYSAYGKAPFFEYFQEDFKNIWDAKMTSLVQLSLAMHTLVLKLLGWKQSFSIQKKEQRDSFNPNLIDQIVPKKDFSTRNFYNPRQYGQLFGNSFVPNLSIVDLLMNEGPNASSVLFNSKK